MSNQKPESKTDHEEGDHTQPINLVSARTSLPTVYSTPVSSVRPGVEPAARQGLMTLYFRTPTPRPPGQVMGPVVGTQVSTTQNFSPKQAQDYKGTSWTVIRMPPNSDSTTTAASSVTSGLLPSALSGQGGSRHMIPGTMHPVIASGGTGPSMASIIRGTQVAPAGHVIHQSFSSHVPRGPAAVASISAAPKSAVATPILRTPHSGGTMALSSPSMMALHTNVRAKSPTVTSRTATPPVAGSVVDLQKSVSTTTSHIGLGSRTLDSSVVRTGPHSSSITIAKPINISQPIVQHLQQPFQVYDKGGLKPMTSPATLTHHIIPSSFTSVSDSALPTISRATASSGFSTNIMQLPAGQSVQTLRTTQALHPLTSVTATPHQTLTVISAKVPGSHSIALAAPTPRSVTSGMPNTPGSTIVQTPSARAISVSNSGSIPVAKVYPQCPAPTRPTMDPTQESGRSFQPLISPARVAPSTTASGTEKQPENTSAIRLTSLAKSVGSSVGYSQSPTTYLYHDQYPGSVAMHPYTTNASTGYSTAQLRPMTFSQHGSSNTHPPLTASNSVPSLNSVMVAVDSRHHVALHPYGNNPVSKGTELSSGSPSSMTVSTPGVVTTTYNTSGSNNHTSPRPSILRKRPSDGLTSVAKKNLSGSLGISETTNTRPDVNLSHMSFTSVLAPKNSERQKEASVVASSSPAEKPSPAPLISGFAIKKEPVISEISESSMNERPVEASPRKKPRKQLLATNELTETHSSEGDENNFEVKSEVKTEPKEEPVEDEKPKPVGFKRPSMSLLTQYRHSWKARQNHFIRHSDVRLREEKKPTVNELANQKGILQQANGWKIFHLSAQMEEVIELEEGVYSRLSQLLEFVEKDPPALKNRSMSISDEDKIINKLTDLIKGNLQRSKIVQEQVAESKQQAIKILDHKTNIMEIVNKYVSRRPLKKKEKL